MRAPGVASCLEQISAKNTQMHMHMHMHWHWHCQGTATSDGLLGAVKYFRPGSPHAFLAACCQRFVLLLPCVAFKPCSGQAPPQGVLKVSDF